MEQTWLPEQWLYGEKCIANKQWSDGMMPREKFWCDPHVYSSGTFCHHSTCSRGQGDMQQHWNRGKGHLVQMGDMTVVLYGRINVASRSEFLNTCAWCRKSPEALSLSPILCSHPGGGGGYSEKFLTGVCGSIGYPWLRKFWSKTYPWLRRIS